MSAPFAHVCIKDQAVGVWRVFADGSRQTAVLTDWQIVALQYLGAVGDCRQIDAFHHDAVFVSDFSWLYIPGPNF